MINRQICAVGGAAVIGALLLGLSPEVRSAPGPEVIRIENFHFTPPNLVVEAGTTVTWTNADDEAHTVVEKDRRFKSAALDTNEAFSQTFTVPGEYDYICSIHPYMTGKIVVKPKS